MLDSSVVLLLQEIASDGDLASMRPALRQAAVELLIEHERELERRADYFLLQSHGGGTA